ncbi:hypothetical protein [Candidatus Korobacter versatilis]|uniref:hypothetical protein n=1 Tax=Candidatus Korobacter versatilis TaxID=658062 RepID=UPI0002F9390B|nr:hypothetical protein [Candidatus Koribacter versatilis]
MENDTPQWLAKLAKSRTVKVLLAGLCLLLIGIQVYGIVQKKRAHLPIFFDTTYENVLAAALVIVMLVAIFVTGKARSR